MSQDHNHAAPDFGRAFAIGIVLNLVYVLVEAFVGMRVGSMALLADAGHNASDILGLVIAWVGASLAKRPPSERFSFGLKRSPLVASLFNALLLFGAMGVVAREAIANLETPNLVPSATIIWIASVGLVVNFGTALLFLRGRDDLNIRGAYLHMFADGLVTLGVLLSGVVMYFTGWAWMDSVISLMIVAVVLFSTWGLFRDALRLSVDAAPTSVDVAAVRAWIQRCPEVVSIHDLHIRAMSTSEVSLTAHVVVATERQVSSELLNHIREGLHQEFEIRHVTIQLESDEENDENCQPGCQ